MIRELTPFLPLILAGALAPANAQAVTQPTLTTEDVRAVIAGTLSGGPFDMPAGSTIGGKPIDDSAARTAAVAVLQGLIPTPSSSAPPPEAVTASPGTQTSVYALANHVHPRITRSGTVVTASDGTISGSWTVPLTGTPQLVLTPAYGAPMTCQPTAGGITPSSFTGKCWVMQNPMLAAVMVAGVSVAVGSQVVPTYAVAPAGISVSYVALPPTS